MTRFGAIPLVLLAALVGGCGSHGGKSQGSTSGSTPKTSTAAGLLPPNLVTNADLAATQAGSPSRTTLEWFQAVQFQDVGAVRRLSTSAAVKGLSDTTLTSWLSTFGPNFVRPQITAVITNGGAVSMRMLLLTYSARSGAPTSEQPFTLRLTRAGTSWLVSDISLLKLYAKTYHVSR
jgi:hypothetical protein